jgi:hypothetical protein
MRTLVASVALLPLALAGCQGEPPAAGDTLVEPTGQVETVTQDLKVPNTKFGKGVPGGMYYNGTLFLTYTGTGNGEINVVRRENGQFLRYTLSQRSSHGSQMINFNGTAFLAFCFLGSVGVLKSTNPADGTSWQSAGVANTENCGADPALVVYGGVLTMFVPNPLNIWQFNYDPASNSWANVAFLGDTATGASPSAVKLGEDLLLSWVGFADGRVFLKKYVFAEGWRQPVVFPKFYRSHLIPGNTPTPSALLIGSVAVGNIGPNTIHFERTFNGSSFEYLGHVDDTTKQRPHGVATDAGFVEFAYRGTNDALYLRSSALPTP